MFLSVSLSLSHLFPLSLCTGSMDTVETQNIDIREVPDPESPDKALPTDAVPPKTLKDLKKFRIPQKTPPSTPSPTTPSPPTKTERKLEFTPEEKVLQRLNCLYVINALYNSVESDSSRELFDLR